MNKPHHSNGSRKQQSNTKPRSASWRPGMVLYAVLILAGFLAGKAVPTKNPNYGTVETAIMSDEDANRVLCVRGASTEGNWTPVYNFGK
jgi:hypothetical protein